ncbi:2-oxo-4-hydroxy-4-carboxy-5-ureidoimidazoline decarboxylase [Gammaproteobacteria bacterium ESL0073]|nr:2-oxo-4-hydroxy-4-carboxy-5-ureidoimidazoline decarboxylase [Gammaproteobacteria bacterium ESL0073]
MKLRQLFVGVFLCLSFSMGANADVSNKAPYRFQDINKMSETDYVTTFTPLFNNAPWVVKESSQKRPFTGFVNMYETMVTIIKNSDHDTQLSLIKTHPRLACKSLRAKNIAAHSLSEQSGSGLNVCTEEEAQRLQTLNDKYHEKFGYDFLLAIKGYDKQAIFVELEDRLNNDPNTEFNVAMQQFYKILLMRMLDSVK